jgi:hypothetical protein
MKMRKELLVVAVLATCVGAFADDVSERCELGVNFKMTDDLTLSASGDLHFGRQLQQSDDWRTELVYDSTGLAGYQIAPGFEVTIGDFGNVHIAGGAELVFDVRSLLDTAAQTSAMKYLEITPRANLILSMAFAGGFGAELANMFERRNFRGPLGGQDPGTAFRFTPRVTLSSPPLTPVRVAPYLFYASLLQKNSSHMAEWGFGTAVEPVDGLDVILGDRIVWKPLVVGTTVHQITLGIEYTFDFARE